MKQPARFDDSTRHICQLVKVLYGLKQAGNAWNHEFDDAMKDLKYKNTKSNYYCYSWQQGENFAIVLVWVDNLVTFTNNPIQIK